METSVHRALRSGVVVLFSGLAFAACGSFGTAPADGGATDVDSGASDGGVPSTPDSAPVMQADGGPAPARFCTGHRTAAICADFDDRILSQVFVFGEPKTAGVEPLAPSTASPVDGAFFSSALSNTTAAWFIVPMNLLMNDPFRLSVEIETVAIPAGGRVELMQIPDKGNANPMRVWIEGESVVLGFADGRPSLATVNRQPGPFKVVLERQAFGVALGDDEPITVVLQNPPLSDLREVKIGAGFPTTGGAQIRFDDVLVERIVR